MFDPVILIKTCTNPGCSERAERKSQYCTYHISRERKSKVIDVVLIGSMLAAFILIAIAYYPS